MVAPLGKLDEREAAQLAQGWADLSALLAGEPAPKPAATPDLPEPSAPPPAAPPPQWEQVDARSVRVERARDFGEVYLGLALWRRLKLDELLATLLPACREAVDWGRVAALLTIARFCAQRSELGIAEHWYGTTALDDLLGVALKLVNDDRLYRALDQLGAHKDALCTHLMECYR